MPLSITRFADLVGALYDSAIEPACWPVFFDLLNEATNCQSGTLMVLEPAQQTVRYNRFWGVEMALLAEAEKRHGGDPTMAFLYGLAEPGRDPDEPIVYRQVFDDAFLAKSPLYQEFAPGFGLDDAIAVLALQRPNRLGFLVALRSKTNRLMSQQDIEVMRLLTPHVRRAVTISDVLDMRAMETAVLGAAMDVVTEGILLVDSDLRIIHANTAARAMLEHDMPIRSSGGTLETADTAETGRLHAAVKAALPPSSLDRAPGLGGVPLLTGSTSFMAHVLPLNVGAIRMPAKAVAAIFITRDPEPPNVVGGIGAVYNLTAAEQRLAAILADGTPLSAAAEQLKISVNTAKTHASRIYAKTGVARHAELVALLMRLPAQPLGSRVS
jgi:DNA-binding CsgD family transcriptional regulator/PAS domain-containing protein